MDRERLKEVKATDLTEANVNEEFVEWLKTKGLSWLLVVLIALCVYLGVVNWRQRAASHEFNAWQALTEGGSLPKSYEDVAVKYPDVDSVAELANLQAGQMLLRAVQTGYELGGDDTGLPVVLSDAERTSYLERADVYFSHVLDGTGKGNESALLAVNALNGRAAVAEGLGKTDEAKSYYTQAAARAEGWYPELARQARTRAESLDGMVALGRFPAAADVRTTSADEITRTNVAIDPALIDLLLPTEQN